MRSHLKPFLSSETGVTAIEYAVIASLIAAACYAGIVALGAGNGGMWDSVGSKISAALR